jgi:hypothetical protein
VAIATSETTDPPKAPWTVGVEVSLHDPVAAVEAPSNPPAGAVVPEPPDAVTEVGKGGSFELRLAVGTCGFDGVEPAELLPAGVDPPPVHAASRPAATMTAAAAVTPGHPPDRNAAGPVMNQRSIYQVVDIGTIRSSTPSTSYQQLPDFDRGRRRVRVGPRTIRRSYPVSKRIRSGSGSAPYDDSHSGRGITGMGISSTLVRRVANYDDPNSLGSRMRARRTEHLVGLLERVHARKGAVNVIDIGGTRYYWNALPGAALERFNVSVTVVNLPGEEHPGDDERFHYVEGNGCHLDWVADDEFDVAHANSVLEHVGRWSDMCDFAHEVRRAAPAYVVQTPYFWFPIEPHFMAPMFHWLPESTRAKLLLRFKLGHSGKAPDLDEAVRRVQSAQLVDSTMFRTLFPDATIHIERIAGLPKSLMAVRETHSEAGH